VTLQTLGARGRLRGILALGGPVGDVRDGAGGTARLDEASRQVVTTVIALAGLALEQNHALDRARGQLRRGLLRLLVTGEIELVETISTQLWGPLPSEPVIAAIADVPAERAETIAERLERRAADASGRLFFALDGNRVFICVGADARGALDEIADDLVLHLGASEPHDWANLAGAGRQAEHAAESASVQRVQQTQHRPDAPVHAAGNGAAGNGAAGSVTDFSAIAARGVLSLLNGPAARDVARSVLTPLIVHDQAVHDRAAHDPAAHHQANSAQLVGTLHAWLAHNGEYEATARELGVHRHTLRARIATVERLLGRDLSSFATRAELWAALMAASEPA
jgi:purine catabolism regulator